jgi:hypothetical protein
MVIFYIYSTYWHMKSMFYEHQAVIKCIYLPPTYIHFIQGIEDRCLLLITNEFHEFY